MSCELWDDTDREWYFAHPELWPQHQNQIVAVYNRTVLGDGVGYTKAYEAAKATCAASGITCPSPYDISFVIPPVLMPNLPDLPPWDFRDTSPI